MEKYYQIFRLKTKETYEPDGYDIRTIETSKLEHVGSPWLDTEEDATSELERIHDGYSSYVILTVYK